VPRRKPIGGWNDDPVVASSELGGIELKAMDQIVIVKHAGEAVEEEEISRIGTPVLSQGPDRVLADVALQGGRTDDERILHGRPQ